MTNIFDIKCPSCGNTDNLYLRTEDDFIYLSYRDPEIAAAVASGLEFRVWWHTLITCDSCGHEGACETFDGQFAKSMKATRQVMERFHKVFKKVKVDGR
jgi:Zn ribbon nucleic-acid-binding protein